MCTVTHSAGMTSRAAPKTPWKAAPTARAPPARAAAGPAAHPRRDALIDVAAAYVIWREERSEDAGYPRHCRVQAVNNAVAADMDAPRVRGGRCGQRHEAHHAHVGGSVARFGNAVAKELLRHCLGARGDSRPSAT